jgi:hypothetical protein
MTSSQEMIHSQFKMALACQVKGKGFILKTNAQLAWCGVPQALGEDSDHLGAKDPKHRFQLIEYTYNGVNSETRDFHYWVSRDITQTLQASSDLQMLLGLCPDLA